MRPNRLKQGIAALLALAAAGGVALYWASTKPSSKRQKPPKESALVQVIEVQSATRPVIIGASGTVVPSRVVQLRPDVSGRVVALGSKLEPGALLKAGDDVARLDPRDYRIAVRQARSQRAHAKADLELEQGQQQIARKEFELYQRDSDVKAAPSPRALRAPQLSSALASVHNADAALAKASLDLTRTRLTAPFDAMVRSRDVSIGSRVNETTTLATLVGIERWWVEVAVPTDQLRWLDIPRAEGEPGSTAQLFDETAWGPGVSRDGYVLRLGSDLLEGGRLAKLLVAIDDPVGVVEPGKPRLLLGSWVRVSLQGKAVTSVPLPRKLIHDGDRVWVMTADGKLDIRRVQLAARLADEVLVAAGLTSGERVVSSDLPWPVQGMSLELAPERKQLPAKSEHNPAADERQQ